MIRGEYITDKKKCLHDSYDMQNAPWGTNHRDGWKLIDQRPYLAGCFIWTGFDYRGEPQPYEWPAAGASFGIMDQCGFPKAAFYIHQAQWTDQPVLQLIPHWNWPADSIGKPIKVMALTNAQSVKLLLNGKLISAKPVHQYDMVEWAVPYRPGKLEAIAYDNGKEVSRFMVETTGTPVRLELIADRPELSGDGYDAMPVTVRALDDKGRAVPTANIPVTFEVAGPGTIIGLGNGNPNSHEAEKGNQRKLFNGLAQVILQSSFNTNGSLRLKANSAGIASAEITILVNKTAPIPSVE
jgi:beta-galactosidase